jgi:hypothetical protein
LAVKFTAILIKLQNGICLGMGVDTVTSIQRRQTNSLSRIARLFTVIDMTIPTLFTSVTGGLLECDAQYTGTSHRGQTLTCIKNRVVPSAKLTSYENPHLIL